MTARKARQLLLDPEGPHTSHTPAPTLEPLGLRLKRLHEEIAEEQSYRTDLDPARERAKKVITKIMPDWVKTMKLKKHPVIVDGEEAEIDDLDLALSDPKLVRGPNLSGDGYSHVNIYSCDCSTDMEGGRNKLLYCDGEIHARYRRSISGRFGWIPYVVCPIKQRELEARRAAAAA